MALFYLIIVIKFFPPRKHNASQLQTICLTMFGEIVAVFFSEHRLSIGHASNDRNI
jgi:hypothetical protein